jgi:hypothetical protein
MIHFIWIGALLMLGVTAALAEDLSKLNSYAVTFGVASSSAQNVSKITAYAVVTGGGAAPIRGNSGGLSGSLHLGIN